MEGKTIYVVIEGVTPLLPNRFVYVCGGCIR